MYSFNRKVVLIFLILYISYFKVQVSAECCQTGPTGLGKKGLDIIMRKCHMDVYEASKYCMDCSLGTPHCGKGPCNLFGCACEGGCRE